jgi:signal transduction histidine kinase
MNAIKLPQLLGKGTLSFTIESRILRELGERLVKQPEIALLELVKNAYDADAPMCEIVRDVPDQILVRDSGHGMTLAAFKNGWMRVGTSSKEALITSSEYGRIITGEKGIGRFAVRFLGKALHLESVAFDPDRNVKTRLIADFDWVDFDQHEDLGQIKVPYRLVQAEDDSPTGTLLTITKLRPSAEAINLYAVRTAAIGVVTPYQSLLRPMRSKSDRGRKSGKLDPGFSLKIRGDDEDDGDVAKDVLDNFVLRAVVELQGDRLKLAVYRRDTTNAVIDINDHYPNTIGGVYADIRFFPQRKGTFTDLPIDGRRAKTWVKDHSGVAVFDRTFRVHPYGFEFDDWLRLSADTAKRAREPRSSIAKKHFPMDEPTQQSTQLNYMLRLPYSQQLVGVVQVTGRRNKDGEDNDEGLIATADREGFVDNGAFRRLRDLIRGAIEAIASADRELQQELERAERDDLLQQLKTETQEAIREIEANPRISKEERVRIVKRLAQTQVIAEQHEERSRQRESTLEIMSLLGVVAGFMTHEFGTALDELERAQQQLMKLARRDSSFKTAAESISEHMNNLREFVTYSQGYIHGASSRPTKPYPARPRIQQVIRIFGKYAAERDISLEVNAESDVMAPLVPVSLYNGLILNLYTNALKAVTAQSGEGERRIALRAWNEQNWHYLEVSDTGIGIPTALRHRVFEPLFTTTSSNRDPLGSGMGLGLSLVKRGAEGYGGRAEVVDPPAGFTTCVRIKLPIAEQD